MKAGREADILAGALKLLELRGIPAWRQNTGATRMPSGRFVRFGMPGMPDIIGVLPGGRAPNGTGRPAGRTLMVECKRPGGRLRPAQRACIERLRAAGAVVLVVSDLAELDADLARLLADPWQREGP